MRIIEQKKNDLLDRNEFLISIESQHSPSKIEITKKLSEHSKTPEDNIVIESIKGVFGSKNFIIKAKYYNNLESKKKYETITRKERKKLKESEATKKAEWVKNKNGKKN